LQEHVFAQAQSILGFGCGRRCESALLQPV